MTSSEQFGTTYTAGESPVTGGYPAGGYVPPIDSASHRAPSDDAPSTTDVAKDQAAGVAGGAADAAQHVAGVAKDQVGQVTTEAVNQAKNLLGNAQSELSGQASVQQERAAAGLHSVGDQLKAMASKSDQPGMATDLAHQAADKAHQIASWLEARDPASVLDEVRSFARQRPGAFLGIALGAGIVAGRLARNLSADPAQLGSPAASPAPRPTVGYQPPPAALPATPAVSLPPHLDTELYGTGAVPDWTGESSGGQR